MLQRLPSPVRLKSTTLSRLTSFMLGGAWAIVLVGAISTFFSFLKINFILALLSSFIGAMPGLFLVLFLEYFILKSDMLSEMRKQTALMQKSLKKTEKKCP